MKKFARKLMNNEKLDRIKMVIGYTTTNSPKRDGVDGNGIVASQI